MAPKDSQSRSPLAILLMLGLVILLGGLLWNHGDDRTWGRQQNRSETDEVEGPKKDDSLLRTVERQQGLSEASKKSRLHGKGTEGGTEFGGLAELDEFPKTEDFLTSQPLELALIREPGELAGWVTDSKSQPLAGARVRLQFEREIEGGAKAPKLEASTNDSGLFLIPKVPPGDWTVVAEKDHYATSVATGIEVLSGDRPSPVVLRMEPEIRLKGVVNAGGKAVVPNASVIAVRNHLAVHGQRMVENVKVTYSDTTTSEKGEFELDQLPSGEMILRVVAVGFAPLETTVVIKPNPPPVTLSLVPEAILSGIVKNELGKPVPGAELELATPAEDEKKSEPIAKLNTEENGTFIFRQLPANRQFLLTAKAPEYAITGPLAVVSGTTTNVIVLSSGGSIRGTVTNLNDGDPAPHVGIVAVSEAAPKGVSLMTLTNSKGRYRISRLPAGTYTVAVYNEKLTSEPRAGINVNSNTATDKIDFSIYPGIDIAGVVSDGDTGERLVNARVALKSRVGAGFLVARNNEMRSNAAGAFKFTNLPQGLYDLGAELQGYIRGTGEEQVRVELLRLSTPEPVDLKLYRGGTIEGIVYSVSGAAVSEALVQLFHGPGSPGRIRAEDFKATTNSGGSFLIEGIPVQNELHLFLSAWKRGYPKGRSEVIVLNRNQNIKEVDIHLGAGSTLDIETKDPSGNGIADVDLQLSHPSFPGDAAPPAWKVKTGRDGHGFLGDLPPGRVSVSASRAGYLSASGAAQITEEPFAQLSIVMEPARILAGRVQDDLLVPVRAGKVTARPEPRAKGSGTAPIKEDSTYRIETLGEGTFNIEALVQMNTETGGRQIVWSFPGIMPNGGIAEEVLTVPINGELEGRVITGDDTPLPSYTVSLTATYKDSASRRQGFNTAFAFTKGDSFRFTTLPPGEYRVTVSAPNFLPMTDGPFDVESPGSTSVGTFKLNPGGKLRYAVADLKTKEPLAGVVGKLTPDGPSGKSGADGVTTINPIRPAIYTLELSHPDYLLKSKPIVKITRGKETDEGLILLDPGAKLFGKVSDGDDKPLGGILVEARAINAESIKRVNTDSSGNYTFRGLIPGGQVVTFSGLVNNRKVVKSINVIVKADEDLRQDVTLWANSQLDGMLIAAPEVDLRRSTVTLYPMRADNFPSISDPVRVTDISNGRFIVKDLVEGYYLVAVQAPMTGGPMNFWADLAPVFSRRSAANVRQGSIRVTGRILDRAGSPLARQDVRLDLLTAPQSGVIPLRRWWQWTVRTNAAGTFDVQRLPAGTYSLTAHNDQLQADILEIFTITSDQQVYERNFAFE